MTKRTPLRRQYLFRLMMSGLFAGFLALGARAQGVEPPACEKNPGDYCWKGIPAPGCCYDLCPDGPTVCNGGPDKICGWGC